jgi:ATP-dependent Clp protease adaptor protein ClpS
MTVVSPKEEVKTGAVSNGHNIILFNDDHNDFDFVIAALIKYCRHTPLQAEQCALITHHNGKCAVKQGEINELIPINQALLDSGLNSEIQ